MFPSGPLIGEKESAAGQNPDSFAYSIALQITSRWGLRFPHNTLFPYLFSARFKLRFDKADTDRRREVNEAATGKMCLREIKETSTLKKSNRSGT